MGSCHFNITLIHFYWLLLLEPVLRLPALVSSFFVENSYWTFIAIQLTGYQVMRHLGLWNLETDYKQFYICVYMCVCMSVYAYVCLYVCAYTCVYIWCIYVYMYMCMVYVYMYIYVYMYVYMHIYIYIYINILLFNS